MRAVRGLPKKRTWSAAILRLFKPKVVRPKRGKGSYKRTTRRVDP